MRFEAEFINLLLVISFDFNNIFDGQWQILNVNTSNDTMKDSDIKSDLERLVNVLLYEANTENNVNKKRIA